VARALKREARVLRGGHPPVKKAAALRSLVQLESSGPYTWRELVELFMRAGLSYSSAGSFVNELLIKGVLEKENHTYHINRKLLEELLREYEERLQR